MMNRSEIELSKLNIDSFLVTKKENIGYLTNFWGSFAIGLINAESTYLFTDSRYIEEAKSNVYNNTIVKPYKEIEAFLPEGRIGFEGDDVSVSQLARWKKQYKKASFTPLKNLLEQKRITKDNNELQTISKAAGINDRILSKTKYAIVPGISEKDLQWEIRKLAHQYGADKMAFKTIVAFGSNSGIPHHATGEKKLKKGEIVLIDLGVKYKNYCSDITRVFFTNKPKPEEKKIYEIVFEAQKIAIEKLKNSKLANEVDLAARRYIEEMGFGNHFEHSLGHGVGLEIHESPNLSPKSMNKLAENQVFTIAPGIYLPGKFGIRIEDLFVYKKNSPHALSGYTKKIEELVLEL